MVACTRVQSRVIQATHPSNRAQYSVLADFFGELTFVIPRTYQPVNRFKNKIWNFFLDFCANADINSYMETKLLFDGRLTSDGAYQLLKPHYPSILDCITIPWNTWEDLQAVAPDACLPLLPRTRAGIIHDHMEQQAMRRFAGSEPDVMLYSNAGFLIVDFSGKIKMRFKKLSSDLHPCNVKTNQQRAYDDQTLFAPPATLVTAGYRVDSAGMFRDAQIVCWSGSELRWFLPLRELGGLQVIQAVPSREPREPIVSAKKIAAKKAN